MTLQASPVSDVSTFLLPWERAAAQKVLEVMQDVQLRAPDAFSARLGVAVAGGSDPVVSAVGLHLGPASELRELLDPWRSRTASTRTGCSRFRGLSGADRPVPVVCSATATVLTLSRYE
jgi:hypothetical protein